MKFILPDNPKLNTMGEYSQPFYQSKFNKRNYRIFLNYELFNLRDCQFTYNLAAKKKKYSYRAFEITDEQS